MGAALIRALKALDKLEGANEDQTVGILDPAKVTHLALQNAASVAGLLLTTEVMIAEAPGRRTA